MASAKDSKCPWCGSVRRSGEVEVKRDATERGAVIKRRCSKCGKILSAYLESEGSFLPRIRTF